ncbi:MAG: hypothetical protein JHC29_03990 [Thermoplasmata archaeon]|jgi:hypothetical protein|nr:hypothetical protein [Thermoplasmata archaeon]
MNDEILIAEKKLINFKGSSGVILPDVVVRFWNTNIVEIYTNKNHEIIIRPKKE